MAFAGTDLGAFTSLQTTAASAVASFVRLAKAANPRLLYACDPVMSDAAVGFFTDDTLRATFASALVPISDVILPNGFQFCTLSGVALAGTEAVLEAKAAHRRCRRGTGADLR